MQPAVKAAGTGNQVPGGQRRVGWLPLRWPVCVQARSRRPAVIVTARELLIAGFVRSRHARYSGCVAIL